MDSSRVPVHTWGHAGDVADAAGFHDAPGELLAGHAHQLLRSSTHKSQVPAQRLKGSCPDLGLALEHPIGIGLAVQEDANVSATQDSS